MALVNKAIPNITYKVKLRNHRMPYKHLVSKYLHSHKFYSKFKYITVLKPLIAWNDFKRTWCKNAKAIN